MATVYPDAAEATMPETPIKGGFVNIQSQEVAPEYSPGAAPLYVPNETSKDVFYTTVVTDSQRDEYSINRASKKGGNLQMPPHTVPTGRNLLGDIRHHLNCQQYFASNVQFLITQYMTMKSDLEKALSDQAKTEQELRVERSEKRKFQSKCSDLETILKRTEDRLVQTEFERKNSETRLKQAVKELRLTVDKLESAKKQLKAVTRERDEAVRDARNLKDEIEYYKKRIAQLQRELELANAGENAANEREARLSNMLYQVEQQKSATERVKDDESKRARNAEDRANRLSNQKRGLQETITRLEGKVSELEQELRLRKRITFSSEESGDEVYAEERISRMSAQVMEPTRQLETAVKVTESEDPPVEGLSEENPPVEGLSTENPPVEVLTAEVETEMPKAEAPTEEAKPEASSGEAPLPQVTA